MAILRPAITGDVVQDSWADQVTRALNTATLAGGGGGIGGTGSGTGPAGVDGFNTATLYLFARSTTEASPPDAVALETTYVYGSGILTDSNDNTGDPDEADDAISTDWYRAIPDSDLGEYIWTTVVHVADQDDAEAIPANAWSTVTLLARPGDDSAAMVIQAWADDPDSNQVPVWVQPFMGITQVSPNFKNDTAKTIGLIPFIYVGGVELTAAEYTAATYTWTKNGATFTPMADQVDGETGIDMRVVLINEDDVADGNVNEVFNCEVDY